MSFDIGVRRLVHFGAAAALFTLAPASRATAQDPITRIDLPTGRSYPITTPSAISRVSIANPEIADVVVIAEREVVVNAKATGETDAIIWQASGTRQHYRVSVRSPADRQQVALYVKFAEVRRDALRQFGVSSFYNNQTGRTTGTGATGVFNSPANLRGALDSVLVTSGQRFLTVISDLGTRDFLLFLEAEQQRGNATILAEPNLLAANREEATFLAGGELPIPVVQGAGSGAQSQVTVQFREFGVRLRFLPEIISDSLVKLSVRPEVSSLDYGNAVLVNGFRVPAFRTRRIESTVDVRRNESLVISGLFNNERERVRTGIPILMDIPILGNLFSSTRWQNAQSELLVVVTPVIVDPMRPRGQDVIRVKPDTTLPAHESIRERLENPGEGAPSRDRQRSVDRPLPVAPARPAPVPSPSPSQPPR